MIQNIGNKKNCIYIAFAESIISLEPTHRLLWDYLGCVVGGVLRAPGGLFNAHPKGSDCVFHRQQKIFLGILQK